MYQRQMAVTNSSHAPPYSPTNASMFQLSSDPQFAFYLEEVLALANNDGAATGEVLRAATGIVPLDFDSVYQSFYPLAQAIFAQAESAYAKHDLVSARQAYLRAASYYRAAAFFLVEDLNDPRLDSVWNQQLDAFDRATALLDIEVETFSIPARSPNVPGGEFQVIGRFYKAPGNKNERRPTIVLGSGYDAAQEESYHSNGVEILKRGYNFVTYEGPGQPTVRRQQNIGFIPDWYNVATPVVDYLCARKDVDMTRLALIGLSFGGTLAPIAASKEPRFTQVLAIDGLVSIQQTANEELPTPFVTAYENGTVAEFNKLVDVIRGNASLPSSLRWFIDQGLYAFNTTDAHEWYSRLGNISLTADAVRSIVQPVFVAKGQNDQLTLNQADLAYDLLVSARPNGQNLTYFYEFKTALGAGEHVAIGAEAQMAQVTLEWLANEWKIPHRGH
nr:20-hydroxy-prefusarin hydrolase fus2 [Quercus suber]